MEVDIINGESIGIRSASACKPDAIACLYIDREGRVVDVVISRSNGLDELVVEMDGACAAGELGALPACPLV
jgi:hypothetical protein